MHKRITTAISIASMMIAPSLAEAHIHAHKRHGNTNPLRMAYNRAVAHWHKQPSCGNVKIEVELSAPYDFGSVSVTGCTIIVADQQWHTWFGIDQVFPQFCELVSYGYGELLGRHPNISMTPQCARHAVLWWNHRHYYTWVYRGDTYFSGETYPTDLQGV